jgi:hypothetical protein
MSEPGGKGREGIPERERERERERPLSRIGEDH